MHLGLLQQHCKHELHGYMHAFYMHICSARLLLTQGGATLVGDTTSNSRGAPLLALPICVSLSLSLSLLISLNISLYIHKYMVIYFLARPLSASAPPFLHTGPAATSCNVRLLSRESEGSTLLFRFSYTNTCIQICN